MSAAAHRVLLAEDDELVRRVLGVALRRAPFEIVLVDGGEEALRRLGEEAFDVVVTDLRMPHVSGLRLAGWLREHRPATKVVLVTGFTTPDDEVEIAGLGATLLRKPFDGRTLRSLIERLLDPDQP